MHAVVAVAGRVLATALCVVALALGAAGDASASGFAGARLNPIGLGPLRFGMTADEASAALGEPATITPGINGCGDLSTPDAPRTAGLMTFGGHLGYILVFGRGVRTTRGVRVGDTVQRLRRRYRGRLRHGTSGSLGFATERLFTDHRRHGVTYTLEFDIDHGRISFISAGSRHTIETFGECA